MSLKIALIGNPNSGKTTMFNNLTGSTQYVGNWPGVTVERKEGRLKENKNVFIQDLPGVYSLSPYTLEEVITREYLIKNKPDVIINIVDASNIERNLYLTTQLLDLNIPIIVALNMIDVVRKKGDEIDVRKLKGYLGCEIVETSALKGIGSLDVVNKAIKLASNARRIRTNSGIKFSPRVERALLNIKNLIQYLVPEEYLRWYAIKIFERDKKVLKELNISEKNREIIEGIIEKCEAHFSCDSECLITNERYKFVGKIIDECYHPENNGNNDLSRKIDLILTNRFLALPIFAVVMFFVYYFSISSFGGKLTNWVNDVLFDKVLTPSVNRFLISKGAPFWFISLLVDGVIAGVGAVVGFLPQMIVLFFLLAILEDAGYMARIAFIMDRIFRKFGLSGKSFIPMLIATGCGVPGVMASRTIENESDRKITIMTATFMPCGAKLPLIALISGALFKNSIWVAPSCYFLGIASIAISGIILRKNRRFSGDVSPFIMELPKYHMPSVKNVLHHVFDRTKSFLKKASTVILLACIFIWIFSNFDYKFNFVNTNDSILATIGRVIAPIFAPLGWGDFRPAISTITGLVAKENIVGTLGILYDVANFNKISAYSFLVFNLLCAPCIAAIGAIKNEMSNLKWTLFAVSYQTGFAYAISLIIYQLGIFFKGGNFTFGTLVAIILVSIIVYLIMRPSPKYTNRHGLSTVDTVKVG